MAQQHFLSEGYVQVDGLWAPAFADAMAAEAQDRRRVAEVPPTPQGRLRPPIVPASAPSSQTTEANAPILSGLHFALVGLARALSGRMLVPAFAVYNYYEVDDGVWLHVDAEECEVTLLTAALGDVGPLRVHPGLRGSTLDELARIERDPAWSDDGGVPIPYLRLGVTALRGKLLPHHRPGRPVASASAVAALHYCPLF